MNFVQQTGASVQIMTERTKIFVPGEEWNEDRASEILEGKSGIPAEKLKWQVAHADYVNQLLEIEVWDREEESDWNFESIHEGMRVRITTRIDINTLIELWPQKTNLATMLGYKIAGWKDPEDDMDKDQLIINALADEAGLPSYLQMYEAEWELTAAHGRIVVVEIVGNIQQHEGTTIYVKAVNDIDWKSITIPAGTTGILLSNQDEFADPNLVVQVEFDGDYGEGGVYRHEIEIAD